MAHDIGIRLRQVREANGPSQRALAKNTGVSNATISLIESNKLNPSASVLKRILDDIPAHLSAFFADEPHEPAPVVYRSGDLVEIAGGRISYRQWRYDVILNRLVFSCRSDSKRSRLICDRPEIVLSNR